MVGHHICNEWSLCHYTTINDQNNETHGITKGTILFPIYATNCDGSLARDEDHKTITLTKCCLQTPLVLQCETCNAILKWNVLRLPDAHQTCKFRNVLTFVHAVNAATTRCRTTPAACNTHCTQHIEHWDRQNLDWITQPVDQRCGTHHFDRS